MLPSMFSGISGLKANQKKLDVVGNNIANSSTTAFKSQRVRFQDMMSQTMTFASGPNGALGGTNPKQIGLGVQIGGIDTNMGTGSMQPTSRNLDFALDGPGYFVVGRGELKESSGDGNIMLNADDHTISESNGFDTMYTRDGSFTLDTKGDLITSDGLRVFGYPNEAAEIAYKNGEENKNAQHEIGAADGAVTIKKDQLVPLVIPDKIGDDRVQSFTVEKDGCLTVTLASGKNVTIGQLAMASFKNEAGLSKMGKNLYQTSPNSGIPVMRSAKGEDADKDNSKGYGDMLQGMLEMSNVDLAEQFTDMIIASRAFQANGKMISTGDEILQDLVNLKR